MRAARSGKPADQVLLLLVNLILFEIVIFILIILPAFLPRSELPPSINTLQ